VRTPRGEPTCPPASPPSFRFRLSRLGGLAAAFTLLLAPGADALTEPGPVGGEYPVEDRPVPPRGWWMSCTDARGIRSSLVADGANLNLERFDAKGNRLGAPFRVNAAEASLNSFRVACNGSGWVVAQWKDAKGRCYSHRLFDPNGRAASGPLRTMAEGEDCRIRASLAVDASGSFLAVWGEALLDGRSRILVRQYSHDGEPVGGPTAITAITQGWNRQSKVALDDAGAAFVAWTQDTDTGARAVMGRFIGVEGQPLASPFRIDSFGFAAPSDPVIVPKSAGVFEVSWSNPLQGGRVARLVSVRPDEFRSAGAGAPNARHGVAAIRRTADRRCAHERERGVGGSRDCRARGGCMGR
jgi:hypothetical protein